MGKTLLPAPLINDDQPDLSAVCQQLLPRKQHKVTPGAACTRLVNFQS